MCHVRLSDSSGAQLSDNLYSLKAWVTCTSHVHEDTSLKTRQIKVKKTRYKIINQSTHFHQNELLYTNFVTSAEPSTPVSMLIWMSREARDSPYSSQPHADWARI